MLYHGFPSYKYYSHFPAYHEEAIPQNHSREELYKTKFQSLQIFLPVLLDYARYTNDCAKCIGCQFNRTQVNIVKFIIGGLNYKTLLQFPLQNVDFGWQNLSKSWEASHYIFFINLNASNFILNLLHFSSNIFNDNL